MQPSFSLIQALNFAGILPCLYVVLLLCFIAKKKSGVLLAIFYFISLLAGFLIGLLPLLSDERSLWSLPLLVLESTQPAFCFLFILQMLYQKLPSPFYALILLLPLMGGTGLIYSSLIENEACLNPILCVNLANLQMLYQTIATGMVFLFLIVHVSVNQRERQANKIRDDHAYWLVIALVLMQLLQLAVNLLYLADIVDQHREILATNIIRLAFIYLVITSLFRVYDPIKVSIPKPAPKAIDLGFIARIEATMKEQHLYREMRCSRELLAQAVAAPEHAISRAINQHYGKNFNEFINDFRIEEAKQRLRNEKVSITVIAFEVGFNSIASFNRVFKQLVGCSPTEYRAAKPS